MIRSMNRHWSFVLLVLLAAAIVPGAAWANHSWGNYHWARNSNPVVLTLGDNVTSAWDSYLSTAESDWEQSTVLSLSVVSGAANPRNCRPGTGKIEVCNRTYGNNGWLGIAQIWASGNHITKASTRLNDTYFNTPNYNTPSWRRFVMCQEIGHDFGLDHQDENFDNPNLGSCMDYTSNPAGSPNNEHPNSHDYSQLQTIYSHLDAAANGPGGVVQSPAPPAMDQIDFEKRAQWGVLVESSKDKRVQMFMLDFGNGHKVFTHVIWADLERAAKEKPSN